MNPCPLIIHHTIHRIIRRAIRRHAHHALAAALGAGCMAPAGVVFLLPPTVAPVAEERAAVAVPEPVGWGVLGVGLVGLVVVRRRA